MSLKGHWIPLTSRRARLNGRAELFRELRHKTVHVLSVVKDAYVRGIWEGVEHYLWSSDSHPAYRGICAFCSSKSIPQCTAVGAVGGGLLTEESYVRGDTTLSAGKGLFSDNTCSGSPPSA